MWGLAGPRSCFMTDRSRGHNNNRGQSKTLSAEVRTCRVAYCMFPPSYIVRKNGVVGKARSFFKKDITPFKRLKGGYGASTPVV